MELFTLHTCVIRNTRMETRVSVEIQIHKGTGGVEEENRGGEGDEEWME